MPLPNGAQLLTPQPRCRKVWEPVNFLWKITQPHWKSKARRCGTAMQKTERLKNEIADFTQRWLNDEPTMPVHTSGSTGEPKLMYAEKVKMWNSACATIQALGLQNGNTALLCMPLRFIAAQMMLVRAFAAQLQIIAVPPTSRPYRRLHEAPRLCRSHPHAGV